MKKSVTVLKFQIGPVQDFIAAARSTRDLWSGSYLLSFLVAAGIRKLLEVGGELVFPNPEGQPILRESGKNLPVDLALAKDRLKGAGEVFLTPNLPNLFVAKVEGLCPVGIAIWRFPGTPRMRAKITRKATPSTAGISMRAKDTSPPSHSMAIPSANR